MNLEPPGEVDWYPLWMHPIKQAEKTRKAQKGHFRSLAEEKPEIGQHCQVIIVDLVVESWYYQEEVNGKVEDRFLNVRNQVTHWRPYDWRKRTKMTTAERVAAFERLRKAIMGESNTPECTKNRKENKTCA